LPSDIEVLTLMVLPGLAIVVNVVLPASSLPVTVTV
jgi:hypothetical protein